MGREHRVEIPNTIYHIINRGNNKAELFRGKKDYGIFLRHLKETQEEKNFLLYCYCLMPNHFHLLIETLETPLSQIMQKLSTCYAIYFNSKYKHTGHVFQNRYTAKVCDKEEYLFKLIQYIHTNPLRAGIIKELDHYKWSSHLVYAGKITNKNLSAEKLFYHMGSNSLTEGHNIYNSLINEFINDKNWRAKKLTLNEILQKISTESKISKKDILSRSQNRKINQARKKISYEALYNHNYTLKEIANFINKDPTAVGRYIKNIKNTLQSCSLVPGTKLQD